MIEDPNSCIMYSFLVFGLMG